MKPSIWNIDFIESSNFFNLCELNKYLLYLLMLTALNNFCL